MTEAIAIMNLAWPAAVVAVEATPEQEPLRAFDDELEEASVAAIAAMIAPQQVVPFEQPKPIELADLLAPKTAPIAPEAAAAVIEAAPPVIEDRAEEEHTSPESQPDEPDRSISYAALARPIVAATSEEPVETEPQPIRHDHHFLTSLVADLPAVKSAPAPEPVAGPQAPQIVREPLEIDRALEPQSAHFGRGRAEIVIGEGPDRIALEIAADRFRVHVTATTRTEALASLLQNTSAELSRALRVHGLELGQMSTNTERAPDEPRDHHQHDRPARERDDEEPARRPLKPGTARFTL